MPRIVTVALLLALALFASTLAQAGPGYQDPECGMQSTAGPAGKWFVICGSYPDSQNNAAMQRLAMIQQYAPDAMVIHTTGYYNLRDGLLAVVIGPYEKNYATQRLQQIRGIVPDAYVKAGW